MNRKRIAINGMGRIGRLVFRKLIQDERFEVCAVNDVRSFDVMTHLLRYDSEHGGWPLAELPEYRDGYISVGKQRITVLQEADAQKLPWNRLGIELVIDCSGRYTTREKAHAHIDAGAGRVLISGAAGKDVPTIVYGINENSISIDDAIISGASCSTIGLAPLAKALNDLFPIDYGIATTIHALTPTQMVLDNPQSKGDLRRSRTASTNIIPTTAAAAQAVGLVLPELAGKLTGSAIRTPVTRGSLITLHAVVSHKEVLSALTLNEGMRKAKSELFDYTEDELVSSDFAGTEYESVFDATQTKVGQLSDGKYLVEVAAWFDNETSYVSHFIKLAAIL